MGKCVACRQGFEWECLWLGKCDTTANASAVVAGTINARPIDNLELPEESELDEEQEITLNEQDDSKLKDQQSTGRKRAAKLYPLDKDKNCEWSQSKSCGGGDHPIVGCIAGKQQARHHGPDKNTLNNGTGNVHRICHNCHNRWHAQNDPGYVWGSLHNAHTPVVATPDELLKNQMYWSSKKLSRVAD